MEPGSLVTEDGEVIPPDPAERRLRELYRRSATKAMRVSMIRAADGSAVGRDGTARTLNGPEDLRILRTNRSLADVVIVGAQTARVDAYGDIRLGPSLVAEREACGQSRLPDLAIITRDPQRVPQGLDPERTWIFTTVDLPEIVDTLWEAGHRHLLCEGGPAIARLAIASGLVDDYCLTTSPYPSGPGPMVPDVPAQMQRTRHLEGGGFVMERWSAAPAAAD